MQNKKFNSGDLVRWYESYADDLSMTRDTGIGVILSEKTYLLYSGDMKHTNYNVYRNKHQDVLAFMPENLVKI